MRLLLLLLLLSSPLFSAPVKVGVELLLTPDYQKLIKSKRIGLVTNQTGVTSRGQSNIDFLLDNKENLGYRITALFAPEHGLTGSKHASEPVKDGKSCDNIPIYSLHGSTRRPTAKMVEKIDLFLFDIQDIGSRSYTYISTLFYVMEEAARMGKTVIVADRPNPINGIVVDGPMLEKEWRSFIGYVNVPYCHGMTVGELATFFNEEYKIGCKLHVIPMQGWKREMTFSQTGLPWIPTSPQIPEPTSVFFYPMTGIIGELQLVNIGVGYTLPFKVIGAPWIQAVELANQLNALKLPGVCFQPFHYTPFFGKFAKRECQGVLIVVTNPLKMLPVTTQYALLGMLKSLYPKEFEEALKNSAKNHTLFNKVNGTAKALKLLQEAPHPGWALREIHAKERAEFLILRKKYLNPIYTQEISKF